MTKVIAGGKGQHAQGNSSAPSCRRCRPSRSCAPSSDYRILFFGITVSPSRMIRPQGIFPQRLRRYGG